MEPRRAVYAIAIEEIGRVDQSMGITLEAAVGLGIILAFYRNKETINIDEMNLMRW